MKYHRLKSGFAIIADSIVKQAKTLGEWEEIESDDMFQEGSYVGGFDGAEMEFCFSLYEENGDEYWFQIPLNDIIKYSKKELLEVKIRKADY